MQKTGIEYLTHTWNPVAMRCTQCSPGCENCWHLRMCERLSKSPTIGINERLAYGGQEGFVLKEPELLTPLKLRKPSIIGVQFMGDLWHEGVSDEFRDAIFAVIAMAKHHTFVALTKRPDRALRYITAPRDEWTSRAGAIQYHCDQYYAITTSEKNFGKDGKRTIISDSWPFPNLWLGLTVCNQPEWGKKKGSFLSIPGKLWISHEPGLGIIDYGDDLKRVLGVVSGGETSSKARPSHPDVFRSDRDQCAAAGTAFYFKQWGEWWPAGKGIVEDRDMVLFGKEAMYRVGQNRAGHLLDGSEYRELAWRVQ